MVIATYNRSDVLRVAVASALDQSHANLQILVVGDGCTDDSEEVVASLGDPRVEWIGLAENSGSQSAPNNAGLRRARGAYVAYLGHDDVWLPTHVSAAVAEIERSGADLVLSGILGLGPRGSGIAMLANVGANPWQSQWLAPSCALHRRLDACVGPLTDPVGEWRDFRSLDEPPDVEFIKRFTTGGRRIGFVPAVTVLKFPSAWEPGSYRGGTAEQQRDILLRSRSQATFTERELARYWLQRRRGLVQAPPAFAWDTISREAPPPRGWQVHLYREARGLPPLPPDELDAASSD